ncbi:MAG: phosphotransacetylase family protein [Chloroflexi bacterium]|nr:phosphotransacetylase family protein [Chloroflexota bacterium]
MVALYVTSVEAAGKTALCAGIGRKLIAQGRKVGYFKPVQLAEQGEGGGKDVAFVREALGLTESIDVISPLHLSRKELWQGLTDDEADFVQGLKRAYGKLSKGKDIVLVEGLSELGEDKVSTLACQNISEILDARVVIVLRYFPFVKLGELTKVARKLGQRLFGVIINFAHEPSMEAVRQHLTESFEKSGVKVLGVIPEVRSLMGVSVKELADALKGEIVTCEDKADALVEDIMLGAMTPDSGIDYFGRKANKAAIIRGDRADMQLAALETSTRCLVLTGNAKPLPAVAGQAEDKCVPLVLVKQGVSETVSGVEKALARASFCTSQKLKKFESVLEKNLDLKALFSQVGL